jgi:hypothetical protein
MGLQSSTEAPATLRRFPATVNKMDDSRSDPRPGDWVQVKSLAEIVQTLDAAGTLDGLPFMPEMVEYCGRRLRVTRVAEKTCVEAPGGDYVIREFRKNDVVFLGELRCSGANHDGCQRQCTLFWKKAWLRKVENGLPPTTPTPAENPELSSTLKTMAAPERYFCQSTELIGATEPIPLPRWKVIAKCVRDVRSGAVGVVSMTGLIVVPLYRKIRDRLVGRPRLVGTLARTPVGDLRLQPGELVEIKSQEEMRQTLDSNGRNRGLICDIELKKFVGRRYRVRSRFERMISEATGQMRHVKATVILEGNTCMCARVIGGCPRLDFCYWREVWLKRVERQ